MQVKPPRLGVCVRTGEIKTERVPPLLAATTGDRTFQLPTAFEGEAAWTACVGDLSVVLASDRPSGTGATSGRLTMGFETARVLAEPDTAAGSNHCGSCSPSWWETTGTRHSVPAG